MKKIMNRVLDLINKNPNGFTLNIRTNKLIRIGIVVAYLETQDSFGKKGLINCIKHAKHNDETIGGWLNENFEMQFDSVKVFTRRDEAMKFAIENQQRYMYDLTNLEEIKVRG